MKAYECQFMFNKMMFDPSLLAIPYNDEVATGLLQFGRQLFLMKSHDMFDQKLCRSMKKALFQK